MTSSLEFLENENISDLILIKEISAAKLKAPYSWDELRSGLLNVLRLVQYSERYDNFKMCRFLLNGYKVITLKELKTNVFIN